MTLTLSVKLWRATMAKSNIDKLTELQKEVGYTSGKGLDPIAVLGFAGEAGEVIAELSTQKGEYMVQAKMHQFKVAGASLDFIKKQIRDKKHEPIQLTAENETALVTEMADQFYYLNAMCLNLNITVGTLALMAFTKVQAKHKANPKWEDKR